MFNTLPVTLTVVGTHLDQVQTVALILPDGTPASTEFQPSASNRFTMILHTLPESGVRELTFTLQLDGRQQEIGPFVVQNYIETRTIDGVRSEYAYTDRVNPAGPYTRMRATPDVNSAPVGILYNGDTVDVLRNDVGGWYQLRVLTSQDPAQHGLDGWIERWLVDNVEVPPAPTPLPILRFSARVDVNFEGSGNSEQFVSCVAGRVRTADGRPYQGALVNVNNGPNNSFNARTGRDGVYRLCGLGPSHWNVSLRQVPGALLARQPVGVVYLNGSAQEAIVHFFQQR
jgi:hypothetical protein